MVDILDDDAPNLSGRMNKEVTKLPREPKEEPEEATDPGEGVFEKESKGGFQCAYDFTSPLAKDNVVASSFSLPLAAPSVYIPEWRLTREWGRHAFPHVTIESLELLSNSHISNSLQYAAVQVVTYLVSAARRLHHVSSDLAKLAFVKAKWNELREKLLGLEEEKHKFEERADLFAGEKASMEEQVVNLDGSVERLSR